MREKTIILGEVYNFERPKGYIPMGFLTTEDEIRDDCKRSRILVSEIIKFDGYKVLGKKIRNKKTFEEFSKIRKL